MTDLIKQAEALEANATVAEHAAKSQHADAERWRAEAAKLREQAREPFRLWVNFGEQDNWTTWRTRDDAIKYQSRRHKRIAVPMVEVRPGYALVKVPTDREIFNAMHRAPGSLVNTQFCRAFTNALGLRDSLAGVEVEK